MSHGNQTWITFGIIPFFTDIFVLPNKYLHCGLISYTSRVWHARS